MLNENSFLYGFYIDKYIILYAEKKKLTKFFEFLIQFKYLRTYVFKSNIYTYINI